MKLLRQGDRVSLKKIARFFSSFAWNIMQVSVSLHSVCLPTEP